MKRTFWIVTSATVAVIFLMTQLLANDITQGHVFVPGEQNITHVEMNAIAGGATINTDFYTGKSALAPSATDVFLYFSVANNAFRKTTLTALQGTTTLITTQTEDGSPTWDDFLLTYDVTGATLRKATLQNVISKGTTNLFANFPDITTPLLADYIGLSEGSTNARITVANFLSLALTNFNYTTAFTNLAVATAASNTSALLIWDASVGSNRQIRLPAIVTNAPSIADLSPGAVMPVVDGGTVYRQVTVSNVGRFVVERYTDSSISPLVGGVGKTNTHGFVYGLTWPQSVNVVAQCNSGDAGYSAGDYVDAYSLQWDNNATNRILLGWNSTSIFVQTPVTNQPGFPKIPTKGTAAMTTIDTSKWQLTINALYTP